MVEDMTTSTPLACRATFRELLLQFPRQKNHQRCQAREGSAGPLPWLHQGAGQKPSGSARDGDDWSRLVG